jgi:hypothetical protein
MKALLQTAALALALSLAAAPAHAQQRVNTSSNGQYGRVTLDANFQPDPYTVSVVAGGPVDASGINSSCVGGLSQRASFTLNYRADDAHPLIISAVADGDSVLAVRAPDGTWSCNDDTDGVNPAVRYDSPRRGRYQIWVGSYDASQTIAAVLYVSEIQSGAAMLAAAEAPDYSLEPAFGQVDLVSGFEPDPYTHAIQAGGSYDASNLQPGCVGFIARAPDYRVNFTAGDAGYPLIFSVNAEADTTLIINDANANWVCDDDGGEQGLNPSIRFDAPSSGQYDVWVGTYSEGATQPSTLNVSEITTQ